MLDGVPLGSVCYHSDMKLTPEQERSLAAVAASASVLESAKERLRQSAFAALNEGVSLKRVAQASGIAHTTLLRWVRAEAAGA